MKRLPTHKLVFLLSFSIILCGWGPTQLLAQDAKPKDATKESEDQIASEITFLQHVQQYYQDAKDAGSTTAGSAAQWLGEQVGGATTSASQTASTASKWVNDLYNQAITAGDTTAKNATTWVSDDLKRIGTWEYMSFDSYGSNMKEMNRLGSERWECFAVQRKPDGESSFYFKRRHRSYLQQLPAKDILRLAPLLQGAASDPK